MLRGTAVTLALALVPLVGPRETRVQEDDVVVAKADSPDPVSPGADLTYVITVQNGEPVPSTVTLTDTLPSGVVFVSAAPGQGLCLPPVGLLITCELGVVAAGSAVTVQVVVRPAAEEGTITNTATIVAVPDTDPTNNTATAVTTVAAGAGLTGTPCTVLGTPLDDTLGGTKGPDVICGLAGDDVIRALQGKDMVLGGDGEDRIAGGPGADTLRGHSGDDRVRGGRKSDRLNGGRGRDRLDGGPGANLLRGGKGRDRCRQRPPDRVTGCP